MPSPLRTAVATLLLLAPATLAACSSPCSSPLRYRLGEVDPRFGIAREEILAALRQAEALWEDQAHRNLFEYADDGALVVNFVYDARQLTAQEIASRKDTIDRASDTADVMKARYTRAKAEFEAAKKDYEAAKAAHDSRVAAYNRKVESWNGRGGAPPEALDDLHREEAAIHAEVDVLERGRLAVNSLAEEANSLSGRYNELAAEVNDNISAINTAAGHEFKQGHLVEGPQGSRIDIFEYTDRVDLVHVLAHELGHAIGLEHNADTSSIMYGQNSTPSLRLSREDVAALNRICGLH